MIIIIRTSQWLRQGEVHGKIQERRHTNDMDISWVSLQGSSSHFYFINTDMAIRQCSIRTPRRSELLAALTEPLPPLKALAMSLLQHRWRSEFMHRKFCNREFTWGFHNHEFTWCFLKTKQLYFTIRLLALDFYAVIVDEGESRINYPRIEIESE